MILRQIDCSSEAIDAPVLDVADVVALERAIEADGTPLYELMKRAGASLANQAKAMCGPEDSVVVLCGSGNNGGDGWVCAQELAETGYQVMLLTVRSADEVSAEPARFAISDALAAGGFSVETPSSCDAESLIANADLIVDCLLGTGFAYDEVREPMASWIVAANEAKTRGAKVMACDVPSGLNAQTGRPAKTCIAADVTVTMLALKSGFLSDSASSYLGRLTLASLE